MNSIAPEQLEDLNVRFNYHPPSSDRVATTHEFIRQKCHDLANTILLDVPAGREQALALTKIEEAMMWANAGIARHQPEEENRGE